MGCKQKKKTSYLVSGNLPEFSCGCFHAGFPDDFRRIRSRHVLFHGDTQPSLLQVWRILITWNKPFRQRQVTWLPSPCCYFYWRFPDLFRHCLNLTSHGPSAGRLFTFRTEWIGYLCFHFTWVMPRRVQGCRTCLSHCFSLSLCDSNSLQDAETRGGRNICCRTLYSYDCMLKVAVMPEKE